MNHAICNKYNRNSEIPKFRHSQQFRKNRFSVTAKNALKKKPLAAFSHGISRRVGFPTQSSRSAVGHKGLVRVYLDIKILYSIVASQRSVPRGPHANVGFHPGLNTAMYPPVLFILILNQTRSLVLF